MVPTYASALSEPKAAKLFEALRADFPCVASAKTISSRYGFARTDYSENTADYKAIEFKKRGSDVYVIVSHEKKGKVLQNAVSLSIYGTDDAYPAKLTNAYADIWNLPKPKPQRRNDGIARFAWTLKFPNGRAEVIISNNPASGLTQIYARTLDLSEEQANDCTL